MILLILYFILIYGLISFLFDLVGLINKIRYYSGNQYDNEHEKIEDDE